jgi:CHAT domain-containing protein
MGRNARWNEQEYRKAGMALRKAVWDPLEPHLRETASVFVVPDGALQLVNLNTLPWGETAYVVEHGPLLHTLSAERDLIEAPHAHPGRGLLALGNPSYQAASPSPQAVRRGGAHSRCADFASLRFQPLPASAAEVRAIVAIWSAQGETAMLLSGADASEADFKRNAAGKRVLHLIPTVCMKQ